MVIKSVKNRIKNYTYIYKIYYEKDKKYQKYKANIIYVRTINNCEADNRILYNNSLQSDCRNNPYYCFYCQQLQGHREEIIKDTFYMIDKVLYSLHENQPLGGRSRGENNF